MQDDLAAAELSSQNARYGPNTMRLDTREKRLRSSLVVVSRHSTFRRRW